MLHPLKDFNKQCIRNSIFGHLSSFGLRTSIQLLMRAKAIRGQQMKGAGLGNCGLGIVSCPGNNLKCSIHLTHAILCAGDHRPAHRGFGRGEPQPNFAADPATPPSRLEDTADRQRRPAASGGPALRGCADKYAAGWLPCAGSVDGWAAARRGRNPVPPEFALQWTG